MFPNNPLFVDKLLQTKQEDIAREVEDMNKYPIFKPKLNVWMLLIILIVLAWFLSVII